MSPFRSRIFPTFHPNFSLPHSPTYNHIEPTFYITIHEEALAQSRLEFIFLHSSCIFIMPPLCFCPLVLYIFYRLVFLLVGARSPSYQIDYMGCIRKSRFHPFPLCSPHFIVGWHNPWPTGQSTPDTLRKKGLAHRRSAEKGIPCCWASAGS